MNVRCKCGRVWHRDYGLHWYDKVQPEHCMWCAPATCMNCKTKRENAPHRLNESSDYDPPMPGSTKCEHCEMPALRLRRNKDGRAVSLCNNMVCLGKEWDRDGAVR